MATFSGLSVRYECAIRGPFSLICRGAFGVNRPINLETRLAPDFYRPMRPACQAAREEVACAPQWESMALISGTAAQGGCSRALDAYLSLAEQTVCRRRPTHTPFLLNREAELYPAARLPLRTLSQPRPFYPPAAAAAASPPPPLPIDEDSALARYEALLAECMAEFSPQQPDWDSGKLTNSAFDSSEAARSAVGSAASSSAVATAPEEPGKALKQATDLRRKLTQHACRLRKK